MIAKIIKLEEYLAEIISLNKPSIVQSISDDMNVDHEIAVALYNEMTTEQEQQMVQAHLSDSLNDAQKLAITHAILDPIVSTKYNQPFGGTDIAEGFNFRREVTNEVARTNMMDWLEENSIEYLIDNRGNFAIKCPDRKTQYKVNRQFEHVLNKWDNGPVRKNVDPDVSRKGLTPVIPISNPLLDTLSEKGVTEAAQDGSMPLPDLSGTPPMFPAKGKGDLTDGHPDLFEDSEDGALSVLGDLINPSSTPYVEKISEDAPEWLVSDDTAERSYFVDTSRGNFEEVEYISEGAGPTRGMGHAPGRIGPRPDDPRGDKHDLPTKFDAGGVEVSADPVADKSRERITKFLAIPQDELMAPEANEDKVALMLKYGIMSEVPEKFWGNFINQFDIIRGKIADIRAKGGNPVIKEAKTKTAKQREKAAKKKLDNMGPKGSGIAAKMAQTTFAKKAGAHDDPDKIYKRKEKHKKDLTQIDEGVLGGATGMTAMPTLSINRLRQLAGLPASSMTIIEEVPVEEKVKVEPIVQTGKELHNIDEAMDHLSEVFNIYKKLSDGDKTELRFNLINTIMGDGVRLSESVIDLLLDKKSSVLLEAITPEEELTSEDREYLGMLISDMKHRIMEDIVNIDNPVIVPSLARIACVLETIQKDLEA